MRPAIYMMASGRNGTIYVGVTSNLPRRAWEHREGVTDGFTKRYGCKLLVWFEAVDTMDAAIGREKQIKAGSRAKKLALIEVMTRCGMTCTSRSPMAEPKHSPSLRAQRSSPEPDQDALDCRASLAMTKEEEPA